MKLIPHLNNRNRRPNGPESGYTLIEMMFVVVVMIMVVLALFSAQLVGFRLGQLVDSKSGASDNSRKTLQQLPVDIQSAKMWNIGNVSGQNFVIISNGAVKGNALQLCQTTNGSQFTLYYFTNDATGNGLLMKTSITNWSPVVICSNLFNTLYFTAEDYNGNLQTNVNNGTNYKSIIHCTLSFFQFLYPLTQVGTNGLYDYYQLDMRATPHLPE